MATEAKLKLLLDLQDNVSKQLDETSESIKKVEDRTKSLQDIFSKAAVIGTAGFAAISAAVFKTYSDYTEASQQMKLATLNLQNALDDITTGQLTEFKNRGVEAGKEMEYLTGIMDQAASAAEQLGFDGEDASVAFSKLYAANKDASQSFEDLSLAENLARYSGQDLSSSVQAIMQLYAGNTKILKQFGIEVDETTTAEDALVIVSNKVKGAAEELKNPLDVLKIQMGNLSENIGQAFSPAVTSALEAITPLITKFAEWAEKNPELITYIAAIGAGIFGLIAVVGTLSVVFASLSGFALTLGMSMAVLMGWIVAIPIAIVALIAIGWALYKHWDEIKAKAIEIWGGIKDWISASVLSIQNAIQNFVNNVKQKWDEVLSWTQTKWSQIATAISSFVMTFVGYLQQGLDTIKNIFWTVIDFIIGLWATMLDIMFPGWEQNLANFLQNTQNVFNEAMAFIQWILSSIGQFFSEKWEEISSIVTSKANQAGQGIDTAFNTAKTFVMNIWNGLVKWFGEAFNLILEPWKKIWDAAKEYLGEIGDSIKAIWESVTSWLSSQIDALMTPINNMLNALQSVWEWAQKVASAVGSAVGSTVSSIVSRGSSITGKASGGSVYGGTPYIVGENGPELFVPGGSGTIIPNGSLVAAGAGGNNFTINISGTFANDRESAIRMGDALVKYLKDNIKL